MKTPRLRSRSLRCLVTLTLAIWPTLLLGQPADEAAIRKASREADQLVKQGDYTAAVAAGEKAVRLAAQLYGDKDLRTSTLVGRLGVLYLDSGDYVKAELFTLSCLQNREAKLGPDHVDLAQSLDQLGALYRLMGRLPLSEKNLLRAKSIREQKLGLDSPVLATTLNKLALTYEAMGRHAAAEELLQRALQIRKEKNGADSEEVATVLNNLGNQHFAMGELSKAEETYRQALVIRETKKGVDHPTVALLLANLGNVYREAGDFPTAERCYQRALEIRETKLGADHPDVAFSLSQLAGLNIAMGQHAKAEEQLQRCLKIREVKLGTGHRYFASTLDQLGSLYMTQRKYDQAEPLFQRALRAKEQYLGKDHLSVAASLLDLAWLQRVRGQFDDAERLNLRAVNIRETQLGKDHPAVAGAVNNLAFLYLVRGDVAKAEPLFKRCIEVRVARLGEDNPLLAIPVTNLALLHGAAERWHEAAAGLDRSRRILHRHASQVLGMLSEQEQLTFLQSKDQPTLHEGLSLGLRQRDDAQIVARSAEWLLNSKGIAQEALAERTLLARAGNDPAGQEVAKELVAVRSRLASMTLENPTQENVTEHRQERAQLQNKEQELSRRLAQATGTQGRASNWVELASVRQALPRKAVLIEIARFPVWDFQGKGEKAWWRPPRYAAWIIPPQGAGAVELVDLGPARAIDTAVLAARKALQEAPAAILAKGETEAEKGLRQHLQKLADLALKPLADKIGAAEQWIIAPDAALWHAPWCALPLADGRYAVEKHQISFLVTGRALAQTQTATHSVNRPLVIADPDYDLGLSQVQAEADRLLQGSKSVASHRGVSRAFNLANVARLPGTAREAQAITPNLRKYAQSEPYLLMREKAVEAVVKTVKRPKVLVISTHGFFLEDQEVDAAQRTSGLEEGRRGGGKSFENPLVRCGLLLAGVNRRNDAKSANQEDGILTGLEIVGTDLRGTELVVLSACETALGKVNNGEGVAGLRQAFQLAGAKSVVATLWQVPDRETTQLMTDFMGQLASQRDKSAALREAQLSLIRSRRTREGSAHPFYWAAFTLTGS